MMSQRDGAESPTSQPLTAKLGSRARHKPEMDHSVQSTHTGTHVNAVPTEQSDAHVSECQRRGKDLDNQMAHAECKKGRVLSNLPAHWPTQGASKTVRERGWEKGASTKREPETRGATDALSRGGERVCSMKGPSRASECLRSNLQPNTCTHSLTKWDSYQKLWWLTSWWS